MAGVHCINTSETEEVKRKKGSFMIEIEALLRGGTASTEENT